MCPPAGPDRDERPVSFLGRPAPAGMDSRVVSIPAHGQLVYEPSEWARALVVVEEGEIELECRGGTSACFGAGSVLFFDGLGLRAVRNSGGETVLLSAVSRRETHQAAKEPSMKPVVVPTAGEGPEPQQCGGGVADTDGRPANRLLRGEVRRGRPPPALPG